MEDYVGVECVLIGLRPQAVRIRVADTDHWIPRSCIEDGGTDADVLWDREGWGVEMELSVAEWKARQEGLY